MSKQTGWRWCSKCGGLAYFGNALCPAGGVHDHSTSGDYTIAVSPPPSTPGLQVGWKWCNKCQTLSYTGGDPSPVPGPCAANGTHSLSYSASYGLSFAGAGQQGQTAWRWCRKCQGLYYAGTSDDPGGKCVTGGPHDGSGPEYALSLTGGPAVGSRQSGWRWCRKCMMLAFDGHRICAGGGSHIHVGSKDHVLDLDAAGSLALGQRGWRWCDYCYSLVWGLSSSYGSCPGKTGGHNIRDAGYVLASVTSAASTAPEATRQVVSGWRWCYKCQMAWNSADLTARCPSEPGSVHASSGSPEYLIEYQLASSATTVPPSTSTPTTTTLPGGDGERGQALSGGLSGGAIAGISVGVGASVLFAGLVVALFCWRRRRTRFSRQENGAIQYASVSVPSAELGTIYSADPRVRPGGRS